MSELMGNLSVKRPQSAASKEPKQTTPFESNLELIFLGILSLSFLGFFIFRGSWLGYVFGHAAGLSIIVFYACLTRAIARWKGFNYRRAFQIGFSAPIIAGVISAFVLPPTVAGFVPLTCGGWVALGTGIIVVLAYLVIKKKSAGPVMPD